MDEVSAGTVQVRYTFGNMIVSQTRNLSTAPTTNFYGYDAHGNIAFLTNGFGTVTDAYTYDAWGTIVSRTGMTTNTRLFAGEEFDPDLGLINLRARQYDGVTGRFTTSDPLDGRLDLPISPNKYLYGRADPANLLDPGGLAALAEEGNFDAVAGALLQATLMVSSAAVTAGVIHVVAKKNYCYFLEGVDLCDAIDGEPADLDKDCPRVRCDCHGEVVPVTGDWWRPEGYTPVPRTVDGTGRGASQAAAQIRCFDDVRENVYSHAANMGDFPDSLRLRNLVLDRCVPY